MKAQRLRRMIADEDDTLTGQRREEHEAEAAEG
jgi:3'-phosphoadenosine 5'-phosphosulfate sulfotransferase (PAPS reductase)/FAD synthetase